MKLKRFITPVISLSILACNQAGSGKAETPLAMDSVMQTAAAPCPEPWNLHGPTGEPRSLISKMINDSVTQQLLFDKVYFEMISPVDIGNGQTRCYLKFYRTDGSLEEEGFGIYTDHPIADFVNDGTWKFYDCKGRLKEMVVFENGKRKN